MGGGSVGAGPKAEDLTDVSDFWQILNTQCQNSDILMEALDWDMSEIWH